MLIAIKQLAPATLTRPRGEEAFRTLASQIRTEDRVDIDLNGPQMLSMSFLDGFIDKLAESQLLPKITFVTKEAVTLRKLGVISYERKLVLFWKESPGDEKRKAVARIQDQAANPRLVN